MTKSVKVYTENESSNSFLPRKVLDRLRAPSHISQGSYYIAATSKAEAGRIAEMVGLPGKTPARLRVASGNLMQGMLDAGLLSRSGEAYAAEAHSQDDRVVVDMTSPELPIVARYERATSDVPTVTLTGADDALEGAIDSVEKCIGPVPHGLDVELALVLDAARAELDRRRANV